MISFVKPNTTIRQKEKNNSQSSITNDKMSKKYQHFYFLSSGGNISANKPPDSIKICTILFSLLFAFSRVIYYLCTIMH